MVLILNYYLQDFFNNSQLFFQNYISIITILPILIIRQINVLFFQFAFECTEKESEHIKCEKNAMNCLDKANFKHYL